MKIPEFLERKLINQYGEGLTKKIVEGYSQDRKVTFRVNNLKATNEEIESILKNKNIEYKKLDWYENAYIINNFKEDKIKGLSIFEDGKIYLQSLSSMLPPIVLEPKEKENILDMAAAPGGKTTQMASMSNNRALITACEKNKIRADRLEYNIKKQGAKCINVMREDSRNLSDFFSFDKILLDAPCSGSGTIQSNNENYKKYFTEELIERSSKTQEKLLQKAISILKKNGEIVYSTCSILKEENEDIIEKVLRKFNLEIVPINEELKEKLETLPCKIEGALCVMPTDLFEGFFVVKLRKI